MKRKITPFQKISALALAVALVAMMVAPAFAVETVMLDIDTTASSTSWQTDDDYSRGACTLIGNGKYLTRLVYYLKNNTATETGLLQASLMTSVAGNGTRVHNSTNILDLADVAWTDDYVPLTFTFSGTYELQSGVTYRLGVNNYGTLGTTLTVSYGTHNGYQKADLATAWSAVTSVTALTVYVQDTGTPISGGSPTDLSSWDNIISSFMSFMVPLFVLLLPAMLLMFLTRRTDKWLLIIGIAIGAGLGYYFGMVPLWLVFLITIGLIGMAYQSVRGGNS